MNQVIFLPNHHLLLIHCMANDIQAPYYGLEGPFLLPLLYSFSLQCVYIVFFLCPDFRAFCLFLFFFNTALTGHSSFLFK